MNLLQILIFHSKHFSQTLKSQFPILYIMAKKKKLTKKQKKKRKKKRRKKGKRR